MSLPYELSHPGPVLALFHHPSISDEVVSLPPQGLAALTGSVFADGDFPVEDKGDLQDVEGDLPMILEAGTGKDANEDTIAGADSRTENIAESDISPNSDDDWLMLEDETVVMIHSQQNVDRQMAIEREAARRVLNQGTILAPIIMYPEVGENWSISQILSVRTPRSWEHVFKDAHHDFLTIERYLQQQRNQPFFPLKQSFFRAFELTPLHMVKVVMVGQDPYPSLSSDGITPRAQGLSFSVSRNDEIPGSLRNIFTELANCYPEKLEGQGRVFKCPDHGDLSYWARQGVLMLNMSLTVRQGTPNSHPGIWLSFVRKVIKAISTVNRTAIYLLLGAPAQKLESEVGERNICIKGVHPSPLSAERGFFGSKVFVRVNRELIKLGKDPVDWNLDPPEDHLNLGSPSVVNPSNTTQE